MLTGLISDKETLRQCKFLFLVDTAELIPALQAPETNGFRCVFGMERGIICSYIYRSNRNIRKHALEAY